MQFENYNIVSSSMEQVNPGLLVSDGFEMQDQNIIPSTDASASFNPEINTIEFYVYDENYNILTSNYEFQNWGINDDANTDEQTLTSTNQLTINPTEDVLNAGYTNGSVYALYNFINLELNSAYNKLYYISEISSDRTEIRLKSNFISDQEIEQSYYPFKDALDNSEYFDEFYITFGENQYQIGVNCELDTSGEQYSVLIKLYDELPTQYFEKDEVYITTKVGETQSFKVSFVTDSIIDDNVDYIKGPNTNLDVTSFINNSTDLMNKKQLITSPSTASEFSLQNILNRKGVTIQPEYSYDNFGEFVNFSSAETRVRNFAQKVNTILNHQADIKTLSNTKGSVLTFDSSQIGSTSGTIISITLKPQNIVATTGALSTAVGSLTNSKDNNVADGVNGTYQIVPNVSGGGSGAVLSITVTSNSISAITATTAGSGYSVVTQSQTLVSQSIQSLDKKVENIIKNFDGYEYFLYYNTSSISYPKIGVSPPTSSYAYPYDLWPTSSYSASVYLGSTDNTNAYYGGVYLSASQFDEDNPNYLYYTIPEFIRDNNQNDNYLQFVNMVGQHFDELWMYTKAISERWNTTNVLDSGIPLQLADDAIAGLGYQGFGNNYNNQDNFIGLQGEDNGSYVPPTGSEIITNYIAVNLGQILNYWQTNYSWEDYVEQIISPGWPYPIDRVSKEIFKRLYHNMSYLVKKKGTTAGLRQLINIWGIPSTILRINEYGGKNKDNSNDWDLWYKRYSYAYKPIGINAHVASSSAVIPHERLRINFDDPTQRFTEEGVPEAIAFRFKTTGYPSSSFAGEFYSQSIIAKISDAGELETGGTLNPAYSGLTDFAVTLNYTGSTSGSYLGSGSNYYHNWGELQFHISCSAADGTVKSSPKIYLPFFNEGWWSCILQRTYYNSATGNTMPYQDYATAAQQFVFSNTNSYGNMSPTDAESITITDNQWPVAITKNYCATDTNAGLADGYEFQPGDIVWNSSMTSAATKAANFKTAVEGNQDCTCVITTVNVANDTCIVFQNQVGPAGNTSGTINSALVQNLVVFPASSPFAFTGGEGNSESGAAQYYYTLAAAQNIYNGYDGTQIGFSQSVQLVENGSNPGTQEQWTKGWNDSGSASGIYFGGLQNGVQIGGGGGAFPKILTDPGKIFSGSLQEFRYYRYALTGQAVNTIDLDRFYDYAMNPESIEGNDISGSQSSFGMVNFRAPFGNELESFFTSSTGYDLGYVKQMNSVHPAVDPEAAFLATASFYSGSSATLTDNSSSFYNVIYYPASSKRTYSETNVENYMLDQPAMGIRNRITNKIQLDDGEVYGNVLSSDISIQQDYQISRSYTEDINRVEVAFSPQDEVNDDIIATYGFGVISDALGDPRNLTEGWKEQYYPALRRTAEDYFEKYNNPNPYDYLRLIKYFDYSLFSAIKNYVPARSSVNTGIVIKQHLLERNRVPNPIIDPNTKIAATPITGSTPHGVVVPENGFNSPIKYKNLVISQSIPNMGYNYGVQVGDESGLNPNPLNTDPVPRVNLPQIVNITGSTGGSLNVYNSIPVLFEYGGTFANTFSSANKQSINFRGTSFDNITDSPYTVYGSMFWNNIQEQGGGSPYGQVELLKTPNSGSFKARIRVDAYWDSTGIIDDNFTVSFSSSIDNWNTLVGQSSVDLVPTNLYMGEGQVPFDNQLTSSFITPEPVEIGNITQFKFFGQSTYFQTANNIGRFKVYFDQVGYVSREDSDFAQAYPVTQSTVLGLVESMDITSHEFYDGEFSGSALTATTQSLLYNPWLIEGGDVFAYNSWFYSGSYNNFSMFSEGKTSPTVTNPQANAQCPSDGQVYFYTSYELGGSTVKFGGGGASSL